MPCMLKWLLVLETTDSGHYTILQGHTEGSFLAGPLLSHARNDSAIFVE